VLLSGLAGVVSHFGGARRMLTLDWSLGRRGLLGARAEGASSELHLVANTFVVVSVRSLTPFEAGAHDVWARSTIRFMSRGTDNCAKNKTREGDAIVRYCI
jgi:hypothetical protein